MRSDNGAALILEDCQKRLDRARKGGNWFARGGDGIDHGTFRSQIAQYHDRVFYEGRVAWAALVMANPRLYLLGDLDSTGTVVYSFDRQYDGLPQALVRVAGSLGALKNTMPKDPVLVSFAAEVRNDSPREINRLVPPSLTASRQVRYETIYIQRHRLPTGYLAHTLFPVIISTSQPTQVMLLPVELWADELVQQWQELARTKPPQRETTGGISAGQYDDLGGVVRRTGEPDSTDDAPGQFGRPNPPTAAHARYAQDGHLVARSLHQQPAAPAPRAPRPAPRYEPEEYEPQSHGHHGVDSSSAAFANNPLRLSAAAAAGIRLMQRQQGIEGVKVRVAVGTRGYEVDFTEDDPQPEVDFMYTCDGITLLVDRESAAMLIGVQMDLVHAPQGMGFVFRSVA